MCWYCGFPVSESLPFGRSLSCHDCGKDLRSCRNCRFFLPGARGDCREANAQPQADKERANFCDWFSFDEKYRKQTAGQQNEQKEAKSSKAAFDNLFK